MKSTALAFSRPVLQVVLTTAALLTGAAASLLWMQEPSSGPIAGASLAMAWLIALQPWRYAPPRGWRRRPSDLRPYFHQPVTLGDLFWQLLLAAGVAAAFIIGLQRFVTIVALVALPHLAWTWFHATALARRDSDAAAHSRSA